MGPVRMLLPLLRVTARLAPGGGGTLLGAALLRCAAPDRVLLRPPATARRAAWAAEAVAVYRASGEGAHPGQRRRDALSRALAVHANTLVLSERYEAAGTTADAALSVPGTRSSPALTAYAVHVRAQALVGCGRAEEALASATEAVERYRRVVSGRRDRALGGLPGALRTQALVLGTLGRTAESVAVYEECAALLRAMPVRELARVQLVRPRVLAELTGGLRTLGRYQDALAAGAEAREAEHGVLVFGFPEIMRPLRVRLRSDLALCHSATGSPAAARTNAEEAVAEARELAAQPQWLAVALNCLAVVLAELTAYDEQLSTLTELTGLYARLAADRPEVFEPLLADALDSLARCHRRTGDHLKAVADTQRAVAVYRRTGRHEDQLARVLANLSIRQYDADDAESAVSSAREAVTLTRGLAESYGEASRSLLARRLRVLARALGRTGDHAAAVACYEEAESLLTGSPGIDADDLAVTISALAVALGRAVLDQLTSGRPEEAVAALRSLLALTHRSDATDVHARCVITFGQARAERPDDVVRAWEQATGEPYPTFVYRRTGTRGRASNPAAR